MNHFYWHCNNENEYTLTCELPRGAFGTISYELFSNGQSVFVYDKLPIRLRLPTPDTIYRLQVVVMCSRRIGFSSNNKSITLKSDLSHVLKIGQTQEEKYKDEEKEEKHQLLSQQSMLSVGSILKHGGAAMSSVRPVPDDDSAVEHSFALCVVFVHHEQNIRKLKNKDGLSQL